MKRKIFAVLLLVVGCLGVLVVEGVSQPPSTSSGSFTPLSPPAPVNVNGTAPPPAQPAPSVSPVESQQQVWTFEQLVEALKAVRARQKELQAQEADLLKKMAEKVEEKRKDLNKSEEVLQQLRGEPSIPPLRRMDFDKDGNKRKK